MSISIRRFAGLANSPGSRPAWLSAQVPMLYNGTKEMAPKLSPEPLVASQINSLVTALNQNVATVLLGKPEPIRLAIVALLSEGHVLIEDAPGVGKTVLAKALARCLDCKFRRLQFTPDLLPSDILGSSVFFPNRGEFEFRPGPIFTNVLLA